jgi:tripartite ATP-independent transporter DctM subunit
MSLAVASLLIFGSLVALLVLGVPFAFAAGAIAVVAALFAFGPDAMFLIASRTFDLSQGFTLIAVPMFVLMASILEKSGIARDLYTALQFLAGRVRGGVAVLTMIIAFILGATTGIVGGEVVLLGLVALPQMLRLGYDRRLALGTICAGGSLGTMVPPSIVLVFYGLYAGVGIGELFLANIIPSVLLTSIYIAYILIRCSLQPELAPRVSVAELGPPPSLGVFIKGVGLPLLVAMSVLGSIYLGVASVTESAACGVAGVIFTAWVRGELSRDLVIAALRQTMFTCGMVMWLVFGTNALIGVYNAIGGIGYAQTLLGDIAGSPAMVLTISILVFLALGFFIDWIGILFLTMPIFLPLVKSYGYDLIWYGVIFNLTVQIAYLTPPFAPAAFYLKSVAPPEISLADIFRSCWPFVGLQLIALVLVVAFPGLVTALPQLVYK